MSDRFKSMTELMEHTVENTDWIIHSVERNSNVIITAIHGGAIEPATTELAELTAENGGFDYFTFKAIRTKANSELHVTSRHYDEPKLMKMIVNNPYAIAIHGCKGEDEIIYMGGKDEQLMDAMTEEFEKLGIDVRQAPSHMSGAHDDNIINCCKTEKGVQLELTSGIRKKLFENQRYNKKSRENSSNWSQFMYDFAEAIINATKNIA
ncbi:poly-gamma-glutamate hydrolase family protein [Staphylococcus sp. GDH8C109P]|uniref:poly-gamma-glutamate hydrolase family protein n=1 Tax=Staphylococcus sp. GDH8C109P TaxID=2804088 RepID=UPI001AEC3683|nr:poly-gamma-glutamate hydrolase family protein [Staphylococcus sp. GDH8C109P]